MKYSVLIIALLLISSTSVKAQMRIGKDLKADVERRYDVAKKLKATTLAVAVDEDQTNLADLVKSSLEKYWKHTNYEIIKPDEVKDYIKNEKYSVLTIVKYVTIENRKEEVSGFAYAIMLGDKKNKTINDATMVSSVSLPDKWTNKAGSSLLDFEYLVPFFIQNLNMNVESFLNKEVGKSYKKRNSIYTEQGINVLKEKTVIIYKKAIGEKFQMKSFCKNFCLNPENVKLVDKDEIAEAIEKQDPSIAFVYDINSTGTIYDAQTAEPLAFGSGRNLTGNKIYIYGVSAIAVALFVYKLSTRK